MNSYDDDDVDDDDCVGGLKNGNGQCQSTGCSYALICSHHWFQVFF